MIFARDINIFTPDANLGESHFFIAADGAFVEVENFKADVVQVQHVESIVQDQVRGLGADATVPVCLVANENAKPRMPMHAADPHQAAVAHGFVDFPFHDREGKAFLHQLLQ